jgi:hypothetical protein
MPQPIALTDTELQMIFDAARPLALSERDKFLRQIAQAIVALPERGEGAIHRAIRATFRQYFDAPDLRANLGKYT